MALRPIAFPLALALVMTIPAPASAAGAAPSADLARLCDEYWQGYLEAHPTAATGLGDKRYDDRLENITPAGIAAEEKRLTAVLTRARAFDPAGLSAAEQLTRSALITQVEGDLAAIGCHFEEWVVDPLGGPQVEFMNLPDYTSIETPQDAASFVKRCRAMGRQIDDQIANLKTGLGKGKTASRDAVIKVIDQLDHLIDSPTESLAVWKPATEPRRGWSPAERDGFGRDLRVAIEVALRPALVRYRELLKTQVLPVARPPEKAGLAAMPDGIECYERMIRVHTSLDMGAEEIHRLGLDQVARFRHDLAELGQKVFGTSDIATIQKRLRADTAMHFRTAEEVESKAREALARADAAVPLWFGQVRPEARCEVKVMGMHEAPYSTIAYYRQPSADGSRPGSYMINTWKPETRPRYEAEALAFHESVPGHHLQIAVAQEMAGLPEFRQHQGVTAFVEGWALYTERLANEMGLYSGDLDRLGMLSYDAWRSCRLVVDTGLHAMGWTRQQAIDYMIENSCLAENNIVNEVDRYLTWPGQALAYKLGQLEILKLRDEARQRLGDAFDIREFHDVVLGSGAVALPVLDQQVRAWITQQEKLK